MILIRYRAPYRLLEYMKKAGLVERHEVVKNTLSRAVSRSVVNTFAINGLRQYCLGLLANGGVEGLRSQSDVDVLFAALEKELNEESELSINFSQTWARRPGAVGMQDLGLRL